MTSIKINNRDYDLASLQFVDAEQRLAAQTAVLQTARLAYANALQAALPSVLEQAQASETIRFS